jgi:hypothetical protein
MPIIAHINEDMGLRVHNIFGFVTPNEFVELARFHRAHPQWVKTDLISIVDVDADVSSITPQHLAALRGDFRQLHERADFALIRRHVWVCPNVPGWSLLEDWLDGRHSHDGQGTEICLVASLASADCLFEQAEIDACASLQGFRELVRIGA